MKKIVLILVVLTSVVALLSFKKSEIQNEFTTNSKDILQQDPILDWIVGVYSEKVRYLSPKGPTSEIYKKDDSFYFSYDGVDVKLKLYRIGGYNRLMLFFEGKTDYKYYIIDIQKGWKEDNISARVDLLTMRRYKLKRNGSRRDKSLVLKKFTK